MKIVVNVVLEIATICYKFSIFHYTSGDLWLKVMRTTINEVLGRQWEAQLEENLKYMNFFTKVMRNLFIAGLVCIWIFNVLPMVTYFYFLDAKGLEVHIHPYAFWYPFNKTEHYFPVYFYEVICGHLVTAVPFTLYAFFLSMVGQLTVLFKCLGEDMATIVNEHKAAKRSKTVEKLNKAVDLHNQLFDMASRLFQIFETPLLVYVMTQASTLCFIAFICSVRKLNRSISSSSGWGSKYFSILQTQSKRIAILSLLVLFNSLMRIYVICWCGENIRENVSKLEIIQRFLKCLEIFKRLKIS